MSYSNGYADPFTVEELPKFRLPMLGMGGVYRAFDISGDDMLPIVKGTVIVGRYVENWLDLKDGTPCIIVSTKEGIQFRRVVNTLRTEATLTLQADNPLFAAQVLPVEEVVEIWEAKAYISSTFPIADLSLDRLASVVLDLQQQVSTMKRPVR